MNRIVKSFIIVITMLFLLSPFSLASDVSFKDQIKKEERKPF